MVKDNSRTSGGRASKDANNRGGGVSGGSKDRNRDSGRDTGKDNSRTVGDRVTKDANNRGSGRDGGSKTSKTAGGSKSEGTLLGGGTLENVATGAMLGGMVGGLPGMVAGAGLGALTGLLSGDETRLGYASSTGARVGRDLRDAGRRPGDSDDRSALRPATEDPKTEPPAAAPPVVTPPSVEPGDPDNVGMRGRRRRMNTLLGGTVGTSLLSPVG